ILQRVLSASVTVDKQLVSSIGKGILVFAAVAQGGERAKELYQLFFSKVQQGYSPEMVKNGVFQATMEVALVNDGPVTLELSVAPSGLK
ncbi:hypothetical protein BUE80_DR013766, partial [Diplocarpon rosae]